jgi:hypothetical protein
MMFGWGEPVPAPTLVQFHAGGRVWWGLVTWSDDLEFYLVEHPEIEAAVWRSGLTDWLTSPAPPGVKYGTMTTGAVRTH